MRAETCSNSDLKARGRASYSGELIVPVDEIKLNKVYSSGLHLKFKTTHIYVYIYIYIYIYIYMYLHTKKLAWVGSGENPPGTKKLTKIYDPKKIHFFANQF